MRLHVHLQGGACKIVWISSLRAPAILGCLSVNAAGRPSARLWRCCLGAPEPALITWVFESMHEIDTHTHHTAHSTHSRCPPLCIGALRPMLGLYFYFCLVSVVY